MAQSAEAFIAHKKKDLLSKPSVAKDIGRAGRLVWRREAVTLRPQSNEPKKVFISRSSSRARGLALRHVPEQPDPDPLPIPLGEELRGRACRCSCPPRS